MLPATPENIASAGIEQRYAEAGGVVVMQYLMPAGSSIGKHVHEFDHLSILAGGSAMLQRDNDAFDSISAGTVVTIKAGVSHKIVAVTDCIWSCIHSEKAVFE